MDGDTYNNILMDMIHVENLQYNQGIDPFKVVNVFLVMFDIGPSNLKYPQVSPSMRAEHSQRAQLCTAPIPRLQSRHGHDR